MIGIPPNSFKLRIYLEVEFYWYMRHESFPRMAEGEGGLFNCASSMAGFVSMTLMKRDDDGDDEDDNHNHP